jgi:hypothetical protein
MGLLDDVLGSAVPGGNLAKPLMIGLVALLGRARLEAASETCSGGLKPLRRPRHPPPLGAPVSRGAVFWVASAVYCRAFNKAVMVMSLIHGSGTDRTSRSRRISFIKPSAQTRSTTCLA